MTIALIGYRGSGKSSVARRLAERLGWSWCDSDALLEERAGQSIRSIFQQCGEEYFRELEAQLLCELVERTATVLALGGGVVLRPDNRERLRRVATVWLTAPAEVLWQRIQQDPSTLTRRPDLTQYGGLDEVRRLLAQRESLYRQCAHCIVDTTTMSIDETARHIARWWNIRSSRAMPSAKADFNRASKA